MIYELSYRRNEAPETVREEPVVLAATLAHPVNADLRAASRALVDQINGVKIGKLEDAIRAFEENDKPQHIIRFASKTIECLDTAKANEARETILKTYGIPNDRRL